MTKKEMKKILLDWTTVRLEKLTHKQLRDLITRNECITQN